MPRNDKSKYDSVIRFRAGQDLQKRLAKLAKTERCSVSHIVRKIAYDATAALEKAV